MMRTFLKLFRNLLLLLLGPILLYLLIALVLSIIAVNSNQTVAQGAPYVYLSSNGVHLDLILPKRYIDLELKKDLHLRPNHRYVSFGWGDENFYVNTPTWDDFEFKNAYIALFTNSPSTVHITRRSSPKSQWIKIPVTQQQLQLLNLYILNSFRLTAQCTKIRIDTKGYSVRDDFYKGVGDYTCFRTCNSWVNNAFKYAGLKAALWTPFDFGLLHKYD